jgi:hypothetical protein
LPSFHFTEQGSVAVRHHTTGVRVLPCVSFLAQFVNYQMPVDEF